MAVQEQVFGDVAVDECVAVDLEGMFEHPEAQEEADRKRRRQEESESHRPAVPGGGLLWQLRLTLVSGFHTIRYV